MALILGIDQSVTNTGLCLIDTEGPLSGARFHSFSSEPDGKATKAKITSTYRQKLRVFLIKHQPDLIAFEEPFDHVMNANTIPLLWMAGATVAIAEGARRPWFHMRPVTWRKEFLGFTTVKELEDKKFVDLKWYREEEKKLAEEQLETGKKTLKLDKKTEDKRKRQVKAGWKKAAIARCQELKMGALGDDQADAAGVAVCASKSDFFKYKVSMAGAA